MTAIAAVAHRGRVYMAGDSRCSDANEQAIQLAAPKVFRVGPVVVGVAGSNYSERVARVVDWTQNWDQQIEKATKAIEGSEVNLLIGHAGRLYYYEGDGCFQTGRYAALGSGASVCLGYLAATPGVPPQDRVRGAVRAAIEHCTSCGGRVSLAWV